MGQLSIKVGSDPEVFLETPEGVFINAYDGMGVYINGTKRHPEKTKYGAIQVDGMAIELNTHPTDSPDEFNELILMGMEDAETRFNAVLSTSSVKEFDIEWLYLQHPASIELGCDPDFNAWAGGDYNLMPNSMVPFRTAGGHVHVGWTENARGEEHINKCCAVIKQMDYVLGLWSLRKDTAGAKRRELYGKAGAFRPKKYGCEYRVLSNFWMFNTELCKEVVKRTLACMYSLNDGLDLSYIYGTFARDLITQGLPDFSPTVSKTMDEIEARIQKYM